MFSSVTAARSARITRLLLNDPVLDAGVKVTDVGSAYATLAATRSASVAPKTHRQRDRISEPSSSPAAPKCKRDSDHSLRLGRPSALRHARPPSRITPHGRSARAAGGARRGAG